LPVPPLRPAITIPGIFLSETCMEFEVMGLPGRHRTMTGLVQNKESMPVAITLHPLKRAVFRRL
jgi:hypothetical protein